MKFIIEQLPEGDSYEWFNVTESDTPSATPVNGGLYCISVEGSFGGGSIEIQFGRAAGNEHTLDSNLTFTENGSYLIEAGRGVFLPVRTGGSSMDVTITATPVPRS